MRLTSTLRPMQKDGFSGSPRQPGRPGWLLSRLPGFLLCGVAALATVPAAAAQDAPPPCTEWARRLPNLSTAVCDAAQLQGNGGRSVRGVPLYQRDVLPTGLTDGPRRRVLVIGGIHGDELSYTSLVLHWIGHAQQAPAELEWRFVPLLNPDGALKQRPTRVNARGVDLNRNFPTEGWAKQAHRYWADRTRRDPRRYPGPAPLSEPESRWLHDEMERRSGWGACTWTRWASSPAAWATTAGCTRACRWSPSNCPARCARPRRRRCARCGWTCCTGWKNGCNRLLYRAPCARYRAASRTSQRQRLSAKKPRGGPLKSQTLRSHPTRRDYAHPAVALIR
jgi:hypothetical protein